MGGQGYPYGITFTQNDTPWGIQRTDVSPVGPLVTLPDVTDFRGEGICDDDCEATDGADDRDADLGRSFLPGATTATWRW